MIIAIDTTKSTNSNKNGYFINIYFILYKSKQKIVICLTALFIKSSFLQLLFIIVIVIIVLLQAKGFQTLLRIKISWYELQVSDIFITYIFFLVSANVLTDNCMNYKSDKVVTSESDTDIFTFNLNGILNQLIVPNNHVYIYIYIYLDVLLELKSILCIKETCSSLEKL